MEWKAALPLLRENHTGVAISVTPKGHAQSTIVSTALLDDKLGFASRTQVGVWAAEHRQIMPSLA